MPNITADKIIGHKLYAERTVNGYNLPDAPNRIIKTYKPGQLIGNVYSYLQKPDGVYWMVYEGNTTIYIKHSGDLKVPDLPDIIAEINRKAEELKKEQKGVVPYYIEKYLPWIIGAIALGIIIPTLRKK